MSLRLMCAIGYPANEDTTFDYVHQQFVLAGVPDKSWPHGVLDVTEMDVIPQFTGTPGPYNQKRTEIYTQFFAARGVNVSMVKLQIHEPIGNKSLNSRQISIQVVTLLTLLESVLVKESLLRKQLDSQLPTGTKSNAETLAALSSEANAIILRASGAVAQLDANYRLDRYMADHSLKSLFPKSAKLIGVEGTGSNQVGGDIRGERYFYALGMHNQMISMAVQLRNDMNQGYDKYCAHQLSLLYQAVSHAGERFTKYHARIQENFDEIKAATSQKGGDKALSSMDVEGHSRLTEDQRKWVLGLVNEIIDEGLHKNLTPRIDLFNNVTNP
ncbi:hypothetical protein BJ742DRAFT_770339 [Cladochytrium replicatum]|nr:hypothetical protein BJ742DRAFT_770339 [Cladochytrium replicatum]